MWSNCERYPQVRLRTSLSWTQKGQPSEPSQWDILHHSSFDLPLVLTPKRVSAFVFLFCSGHSFESGLFFTPWFHPFLIFSPFRDHDADEMPLISSPLMLSRLPSTSQWSEVALENLFWKTAHGLISSVSILFRMARRSVFELMKAHKSKRLSISCWFPDTWYILVHPGTMSIKRGARVQCFGSPGRSRYPDFDILKYILIGGNGDITGRIRPLTLGIPLDAVHNTMKGK